MPPLAGAAEGRDLYALLELPRGADEEAVRKAYRRLALMWHPDKHSAGSEEARLDATERFKRIQHAYSVLSDAAERRFYDEHGADELGAEEVAAGLVDIAALFSPAAFEGFADGDARSFYAVYGGAFARIAEEERRHADKEAGAGAGAGAGGAGADAAGAPAFGSSAAAPADVVAFYAFWGVYQSRMHFGWADEHDAREGRNREERRFMDKANETARRAARRKRTEAIRALASFVRRRDKRYLLLQVEAKRRAEEAEARRRAAALEVAAAAARARAEEAAAHRAEVEAREAELAAAGTFRLADHDDGGVGNGGRRRKGAATAAGGGGGGPQIVRRSVLDAAASAASASAAAAAAVAAAAAAAAAPVEAVAAAAASGAAAAAGAGEVAAGADGGVELLLVCEACRKSFKSEAAFRNHEGSRKHVLAVEAAAAAAVGNEEEEEEEEEEVDGGADEEAEAGNDDADAPVDGSESRDDAAESEDRGSGDDGGATLARFKTASSSAAAASASASAGGGAKPKLNKTELRRLRKKEEADKARSSGGAAEAPAGPAGGAGRGGAGGGGDDGAVTDKAAFKLAAAVLTGGSKGRPMAATAYDLTVRTKMAGGFACASCKEIFVSRNELFAHIKNFGHEAIKDGGDLLAAIDERGLGGGGGSGGKAAARKLKGRAKRIE